MSERAKLARSLYLANMKNLINAVGVANKKRNL